MKKGKRNIFGLINRGYKEESEQFNRINDFIIGKEEAIERRNENNHVNFLDDYVGDEHDKVKKKSKTIPMVDFDKINRMSLKEQVRALKQAYIDLYDEVSIIMNDFEKAESQVSNQSLDVKKIKKEVLSLKEFIREIVGLIPDAYELKVEMDTTDWKLNDIKYSIIDKVEDLKEQALGEVGEIEKANEILEGQIEKMKESIKKYQKEALINQQRFEKQKEINEKLKEKFYELAEKFKKLREAFRNEQEKNKELKMKGNVPINTENIEKIKKEYEMKMTQLEEKLNEVSKQHENDKRIIQQLKQELKEKTESLEVNQDNNNASSLFDSIANNDITIIDEEEIQIKNDNEFDLDLDEEFNLNIENEDLIEEEDIEEENEIESITTKAEETTDEDIELDLNENSEDDEDEFSLEIDLENDEILNDLKIDNDSIEETVEEEIEEIESETNEDELPDELPQYVFIDTDLYTNEMDEAHEYLVKVIGEKGISRNSELKNYINNDSEGRKLFINKNKINNNELYGKIKFLREKNILNSEQVKLGGMHAYNFTAYELSDIGKSYYFKLTKKLPVESEMSKVLKQHSSLSHGYLIIECAEEFEKMGYKVFLDKKNCTFKLKSNGKVQEKVFDMILEKDGKKMHVEVERGTHNQDDFGNAMDKIYEVTQDIYFIAPNSKTLIKQTKTKVFKWITKNGGIENFRGKLTLNFTTLEKIKKNSKTLWETMPL